MGHSGMNSLLILTSEELADRHLLYQKILDYYLGEPAEYLLEFPDSHLSLVEAIFDEVIRDHGLKNVFFQFQLSNSA